MYRAVLYEGVPCSSTTPSSFLALFPQLKPFVPPLLTLLCPLRCPSLLPPFRGLSAVASGVATIWLGLMAANVGLADEPALDFVATEHNNEFELGSFDWSRRLGGANASSSDDEIPGWYSTHCTDGVSDWGGGVAFGLIMATIFLFCGLGLVCDEFFVPSLEMISEKLQVRAVFIRRVNAPFSRAVYARRDHAPCLRAVYARRPVFICPRVRAMCVSRVRCASPS